MNPTNRTRGGLSIEDRAKMLLPARLYYGHKIEKEARKAEPELLMLSDLVRPGCVAIDVGANRGIYSYALSRHAGRVEAFEPNPLIAQFARAMLGRRAQVHEIALSDREGTASLHVPRSEKGQTLHLLGSLGNFHPAEEFDRSDVRLAKLDSFGFHNVGFIKIDVEGSELEVLDGARATISRDRPNLMVELLIRPTAEVMAMVDRIEREFDYQSWIVRNGAKQPARALLAEPRERINTNNVLFTPN